MLMGANEKFLRFSWTRKMSFWIPYSSKHLVKEKLCSTNPFTLENKLVSLHQQSIVLSVIILSSGIFHGRIRGSSSANVLKFFLKYVVHCSLNSGSATWDISSGPKYAPMLVFLSPKVFLIVAKISFAFGLCARIVNPCMCSMWILVSRTNIEHKANEYMMNIIVIIFSWYLVWCHNI